MVENNIIVKVNLWSLNSIDERKKKIVTDLEETKLMFDSLVLRDDKITTNHDLI